MMIQNRLKGLTLLPMILALTACFPSKPAATAPVNKTLTWQQRQNQLQQVTHWQVSGAIAIKSRDKAESASVKWQQRSPSTYTIRLFGPLGVGNTIITGKPGRVSLVTANNRTYSAATSEALLQQQTGWKIPIHHLYFWIRGLPVPGIPHQIRYDAYRHIKSLQQQGWRIQYQRFTAVQGMDLPSKLTISNGAITAKLIIKRWSL